MVAFVISFHGDYVGWQSTGGGRVFAAGSGEDWLCWRALNRQRTEVGRAKTVTRRWGYLDDAQSVDCDCGERHTIAHLLSCRLLYETYTAGDLATVTYRAKACASKWEKIVRTTRQKKKLHNPVLARAPSSMPSIKEKHAVLSASPGVSPSFALRQIWHPLFLSPA